MSVSAGKLAYLIELQAKGGPEAQRLMRDLEYAAKSASSKMAMYSQRSSDEQQTHATKLADARIRLGVHSEKSVQREIYHTMRAYVELKKSGTSSAADIANAHKAMTERIAALNRQIGISTQTSTERQKGYLDQLAAKFDATGKKQAAFNKTIAVGLGVAGGTMAVNAMIQKPVAYDTALAYSANTVFSDRRTKAGREQGIKELDSVITQTIRQYGGSRDQALAGFNKMVGGGAFKYHEAKQMLPFLQKTAVASGSQIDILANLAEKIKVGTNLSGKDLETAIAKIMRSGELGGFEIKDSAEWVAKLLSGVKDMGFKDMDAIENLATMLQQVRSTAGTNDEAANNLRNFLLKANSDGTAKEFKKQGVDLRKEMALGLAKGDSPLDTYMKQLERVAMKTDPTGKARAAMRSAGEIKDPEERKARFDAIKELYRSAGLSVIMGDLQEIAGFKGMDGTKAYGKEVLAEVKKADSSTVDVSYDLINDRIAQKIQRAGNEKDIAMTNSLNVIDGPLKGVLEGATGLAQTFPNLATAVTLLTGTMATAAAVQGAMAIPGILDAAKTIASGGAGGAAKTVSNAVAGAAALLTPAALAAKTVGTVSSGGSILSATGASAAALKTLKVGGYIGAAYAASGVLSRAFANEDNTELSAQDKAGRRGEIAGQTTAMIAGGVAGKVAGKAIGAIGGRMVGMAMGAAMGSVIPVVGTILGGAVGLVLGSVLAEPMGNMGEGIGRRIQGNNAGANAAMAEQAQYDPITGMQIGGFVSTTPSLLREPAYAALSNPAAANNAQGQAALEALKQPTKVELQPSQMTIKIDAPEGYSATAQLTSPTFKLDGGSTAPWSRN